MVFADYDKVGNFILSAISGKAIDAWAAAFYGLWRWQKLATLPQQCWQNSERKKYRNLTGNDLAKRVTIS